MWNKGIKNTTNKQKRVTVSFRLTSEEELKLFEWVKSNGVINGDSAFIKSILYKAYKDNIG